MQNTGFSKRLHGATAAVWTWITLAGLVAAPVQAADAASPTLFTPSSSTTIFGEGSGAAWHSELGLRYWGSWGRTAKNLYGSSRAVLNSRLTYSRLVGNTGELFGQATGGSMFLKGFAGFGVTGSGKLQDEDFPPAISPYSSTDSSQRRGTIGYATIDAGHYFMQTPNSRIGGFIGYNYFKQRVNAYGCTQIGNNSAVCTPAISASTLVITQDNNWHSMRVGVNGETHMGKWTLSGEAAYLPMVRLKGTDSHHLRICSSAGCFTGPVPEDGHGWGYQLQTMLGYRVTPMFSLGLGLRYWYMQTRGHTHFENHVVGGTGFPQPLDWQTTLFGVTAQGTLHF